MGPGGKQLPGTQGSISTGRVSLFQYSVIYRDLCTRLQE